MRRSWSLRTRLVVSAVALIAVVCAVIGTLTTLVLQSYLRGQVDDKVRASVVRAEKKHSQKQPEQQPEQQQSEQQSEQTRPEGTQSEQSDPEQSEQPVDLGFVAVPGQPIGTVGARLSSRGVIVAAAKVNDSPPPAPGIFPPSWTGSTATSGARCAPCASTAARTPFPAGAGRVPRRRHRTRRLSARAPLKDVRETVGALVLVELCVAGAVLLAAGCAGVAVVGIALRPLRRVAATATCVSEIPLHSGEVALHQRVPQAEADPRTEVGQVGAALNRMLGHVGSALAARQESETRVRQFVADASHELRTL
ncbi:hypothetical protein NKH77_25930 [Streptomyces sp. M19]